ncbi:MAG: secondary thiamine-phosphate synthase enzyme YjbQ [Spirochaetaceae bacterium]
MATIQKEITISAKKRGFHLVTEEVLQQLPELLELKAGILVLNLLHTSASISLNECADPEVRIDMERFFNKNVPDDTTYFIHTYEGDDDMPAHIKSMIIGTSLTIAVTDGKLVMGTWQGIYFGEHRNLGGRRRLIATIMG